MRCSLLFVLLALIEALAAQSPPPPPPPPPKVTPVMYGISEEMPYFPYDTAECHEPAKQCGQKALLEYIYSNLDYSKIDFPAKPSKRQMAVVSFTITKTGELEGIHLARSLPEIKGADEEALRLVRKIRDEVGPWTPGKQGGRLVKVRFNLPIKFAIENKLPNR